MGFWGFGFLGQAVLDLKASLKVARTINTNDGSTAISSQLLVKGLVQKPLIEQFP